MPAIRIRVGASLDANVQVVFRPLIEGAKKARQQVASEMRGLSGAVATEANKLGGVYRANYKGIADEADRSAAKQEQAAKRSAKAQEQAIAYVARIRERSYIEEQRREERAETRSRRGIEKRASQTGHWSMRYMDRAVRGAGRLGLDIARGAGVDLSLGGMIGKSVGMQQEAADLSNASYNTGVKGSEKRVDPAAIIAQAREVGDLAAIDPSEAIEGLRAFVSKTGDLRAGRDLLADMAKLAKATGGSLADYTDAAGDVANGLGDVDNKGEKVAAIMRVFAGQGKAGAVEVRHLASQMAKVNAAAGQFGGDPAKNFAMMGALLQVTRAKGGASSATSAATALTTFTNLFSKGARRNAFKKEGVDIEDKQGALLSPEQIIINALKATGGDNERMGKLFADAKARTVTRGFEKTYRDAGGGDAGIDAVKAEFDKYKNLIASTGEIEESLAKAKATEASKIQLFNNQLSKVAEQVAGRVLPQLEKLGPTIIDAVDGLGKLVAWAAENPGKAIAAALTVSIARAGLETVIRSGIENLIKGAAGGGTTGYSGGKGGIGAGLGVLGNLGAALTIASAAITIAEVGMLAIDNVSETAQEGRNAADKADSEMLHAISIYNEKKRQGTVTPADVKELETARASVAARIGETGKRENADEALTQIVAFLTGDGEKYSKVQQDRQNMAFLQDSLRQLNATLAPLGKGVLDVRVTNQPGAPGAAPKVDEGARGGTGLPGRKTFGEM